MARLDLHKHPQHPNVFVTRDGRVFTELHGPSYSAGYHIVRIGKKPFPRHILVLETFHGPRPSPNHVSRHLNGNPGDNRASNLAWGTQKENCQDTIRHGKDTYRRKVYTLIKKRLVEQSRRRYLLQHNVVK